LLTNWKIRQGPKGVHEGLYRTKNRSEEENNEANNLEKGKDLKYKALGFRPFPGLGQKNVKNYILRAIPTLSAHTHELTYKLSN
jgi:hypothetical protein